MHDQTAMVSAQLMAAGLGEAAIAEWTSADPQGAADFDLELIERRTLDGHIQELIYRPTLHV